MDSNDKEIILRTNPHKETIVVLQFLQVRLNNRRQLELRIVEEIRNIRHILRQAEIEGPRDPNLFDTIFAWKDVVEFVDHFVNAWFL